MKEDFALTLKMSNHKITVERDLIPYSQFHCHKYVEIVYFYKGSGKHEIGGEILDIKSGDLFVVPVGMFHKFKGDDLRKINIMIDPEYLCPELNAENFIEEFGKKYLSEQFTLGERKFIYYSDFSHGKNETDIFNILQEYNLQLNGYEQIIKCQTFVLLVNILRKQMESSEGGKMQLVHKEMVEKSVMYIDEHVSEITKAEDVVSHIGYNTVYFNRIFAEYMGMTISQYVRKKKIEYACRLLTSTYCTIERICEMVGYNDLKNFYKSFKSVMKVTPTEYRNVGKMKNIEEQ
ncbi:MAG: helix-turn-helix domain-containing protein [Clostridia bacterium]|nr:helix-turn-helix domain-containing protein [Clostridia bacterium]